jgi:DNA-binding XRE family transcriptional regulator
VATAPNQAQRLLKPFDVGLLIAQGRRRDKLSQEVFARKLGVSRKTVSDLERGAAEHVSLKTAMAALALAGFVLYSAERRPPTLDDIMARRASDRARADELLASQGASTPARATSAALKPASPSQARRKQGI